MSTHAAIITVADRTATLRYSHYDGYPSHMIPALSNADLGEISAAKEIRQLHLDGTVEEFKQPRDPITMPIDQIEMPEWAGHAYVLTRSGWQHATTTKQLKELTA